jgi:hypothetical protein
MAQRMRLITSLASLAGNTRLWRWSWPVTRARILLLISGSVSGPLHQAIRNMLEHVGRQVYVAFGAPHALGLQRSLSTRTMPLRAARDTAIAE